MTLTKELILLVGPPGSGKTTYCKEVLPESFRISQDDQGKEEHWGAFQEAIQEGVQSIVIDRMNYTVEQRLKYLNIAKTNNYKTKIINFSRVPFDICLRRTVEREDHPTIKKGDMNTSRMAISNFFRQYENIGDTESDEIIFY